MAVCAMACVEMLTLSNVRSLVLPFDFGSYSLRGVAFAQLDQCLHALVAIRHHRFCDTGHFHDMAVVSWVCKVSFLSLAVDLTVATSKDKIIWECENGGQLWGESAEACYGNSSSFPNPVCGPGWHRLFSAFILCLLVGPRVQ